MDNTGTFNNLSPLHLLGQLTNSSTNACLHVFSNSVYWSIYIEQGKIIYATDSLEPFDRLERHLRMSSQQNSQLTGEIRLQLRLLFEPDWQIQQLTMDQQYDLGHLPEYQAIHWLIREKHLLDLPAGQLIRALTIEVIESFLLIKAGNYELQELVNSLPIICQLDIESTILYCQARLQIWQSLTPQITSPYQRPYLLVNSRFYNKSLPALQQHFTSWMKGFSLRHLAVILGLDEIQLAQMLYPHILHGSILLHEADPPFDKFPQIEGLSAVNSPQYITQIAAAEVNPILSFNVPEVSALQTTTANGSNNVAENIVINPPNQQKNYKILSVDDSPTILKEISRFLEDEKFSVVTVNEPIKAVMSIIRHKPDLILLDLNMAGIDGYELCRIIRNNSQFTKVPIIFVTGNKGIIDKVKAKIVGSSGYLTKPFTRAELMKMVFMHLTT